MGWVELGMGNATRPHPSTGSGHGPRSLPVHGEGSFLSMGRVDLGIGDFPTRPHPGGNNPPTLSDAERVSVFPILLLIQYFFLPCARGGEFLFHGVGGIGEWMFFRRGLTPAGTTRRPSPMRRGFRPYGISLLKRRFYPLRIGEGQLPTCCLVGSWGEAAVRS